MNLGLLLSQEKPIKPKIQNYSAPIFVYQILKIGAVSFLRICENYLDEFFGQLNPWLS